MSKTPIERLREVTRDRERLRREWDARRNLDVLNLLEICIPAMFGCERFGLFIRDASSDSLWLECGTGVTERSIVVSAKGSMVGEAIETRQPIIHNDLLSTDGAHHLVEKQSGFEVRNALTVPIHDLHDGSSVGAIQVLNRRAGGLWGSEDTQQLQEIAHSIAGAVAMMHKGQHLLAQARNLDRQIATLHSTESAIRGGHMLRTFPPANEAFGSGFLHNRVGSTMMPPFIDPDAYKDLSSSWDTGPNDIFICTHQKVGTHLLKKFLVETVRTLIPLPSRHIYESGDIGSDTVPWPSVMYSQKGRRAWEEHIAKTHDQPRLWYTHSSYDDLPVRSIHPETKFILVFRDPRAVAVSQYFFYKRHPLLGIPDELDLDTFVSIFIDGDLYFGDYHRHVMGWLYRSDERIAPDQLLALRYEDLVEQKILCAHALLDMIYPGATPAEQAIRNIVESTEFNRMKKEITENPQSFHLNPKVYFRSGTTDDWQTHLSPQAIAAIDEKTRAIWGQDLSCPPMTNVKTLPSKEETA